MNTNNLLSFFFLFLSIVLILGSNKLFFLSLGMELILFFSFPFLVYSYFNEYNLGLVYFVPQTIGSLFFFSGIVFDHLNFMVGLGILVKVGLAPFILWYWNFYDELFMIVFFILNGFLKLYIFPLFSLLNYIDVLSIFMVFFLFNSFFGLNLMFNSFFSLNLNLSSWKILYLVGSSMDMIFFFLSVKFSKFYFFILGLAYLLTLFFLLLNSLKGSNFILFHYFLIFWGFPPYWSFLMKWVFLFNLWSSLVFSGKVLITYFGLFLIMIQGCLYMKMILNFIQKMSKFLSFNRGMIVFFSVSWFFWLLFIF